VEEEVGVEVRDVSLWVEQYQNLEVEVRNGLEMAFALCAGEDRCEHSMRLEVVRESCKGTPGRQASSSQEIMTQSVF